MKRLCGVYRREQHAQGEGRGLEHDAHARCHMHASMHVSEVQSNILRNLHHCPSRGEYIRASSARPCPHMRTHRTLSLPPT
eukprot:1960662-Pyramimonas_sp.AAC.1